MLLSLSCARGKGGKKQYKSYEVSRLISSMSVAIVGGRGEEKDFFDFEEEAESRETM